MERFLIRVCFLFEDDSTCYPDAGVFQQYFLVNQEVSFRICFWFLYDLIRISVLIGVPMHYPIRASVRPDSDLERQI